MGEKVGHAVIMYFLVAAFYSIIIKKCNSDHFRARALSDFSNHFFHVSVCIPTVFFGTVSGSRTTAIFFLLFFGHHNWLSKSTDNIVINNRSYPCLTAPIMKFCILVCS